MTFQASPPLNCPVCQLPAERPIGPEPDKRRVGRCPECATQHHVWCWHVHGGCAKPNCLLNPRSRRHGTIPYQPERVHEVFMMDEGPEQAHLNTDRWTAFEKFEAEYASGSHRRMAAAWNEELFGYFQPAEKYRAEIAVANRCVRHMEQLRTEYRQKRWQRVVEIYEANREHFDSCDDFLNGYKPHVEEAIRQLTLQLQQRFNAALEQNDDEALEKILTERASGYTSFAMLDYYERLGILTTEDRTRGVLALERLGVIREIKNYLARVNSQDRALDLYDDKEHELHLADSRALSKNDRSALYDARRARSRDTLRQAVISGDDEQILAAATAALAVGWVLPDATLERVRQAAGRRAARARVAQADNERDLIIAYDEELLADDKLLAQGKRDEINNARRVFKPLLALRRAIRRNDLRAVSVLIQDPALAVGLMQHLDGSEKVVVERVQQAVQTVVELRKAIADRPWTETMLQQIVDWCEGPENLETIDALLSPFEMKQVRNALATFTAIDELRRLEQAPEMAYIKLAIAATYKKAYDAGVILPNTLNWSKIRAALEFQERWRVLTNALGAGDDRAIFEAWNPGYLHEGLELLNDHEKQTLVRALKNTSRKERIASALASEDMQRIEYVQSELARPVDD
ncbi:MAG: hypothetical protein IT331_02465 [Anaerolineae bacterium]|nr:hypothetical protein [Anaerolineae bacterium]